MPSLLHAELTAQQKRLNLEIERAEAMTREARGADDIHRLVDLLAVLRLARMEISITLQLIEGEKRQADE